MEPRSQIMRQLHDEESAKSRKVDSMCNIVFSRFSWNEYAAINTTTANEYVKHSATKYAGLIISLAKFISIKLLQVSICSKHKKPVVVQKKFMGHVVLYVKISAGDDHIPGTFEQSTVTERIKASLGMSNRWRLLMSQHTFVFSETWKLHSTTKTLTRSDTLSIVLQLQLEKNGWMRQEVWFMSTVKILETNVHLQHKNLPPWKVQTNIKLTQTHS